MTFPNSPESRDELDRLLDPDDPVLLDSDRNRIKGTLADLTRVMLRSLNAMTEAEKKSVRDTLDRKLSGEFTAEDQHFLRSISSNL
jgi:hypothetical protein